MSVGVQFSGFVNQADAEAFLERAMTEARHMGFHHLHAEVDSGQRVTCARCSSRRELEQLRYVGSGQYVCGDPRQCAKPAEPKAVQARRASR